MTNFRKTLLAIGIGLALGLSVEARADAESGNNTASFSVAADGSDKSEAEIDRDSNGAAANHGGTAKVDQSDVTAKYDGAAASHGGTASVDNSDHSSASAKGDAVNAMNGGEAWIDKSTNEHSFQKAEYGSVANHDGEVKFSKTEVSLDADVREVTVTPTGVGVLATSPSWTESNRIDNSGNGAAGIVQLSQNIGHGAVIQQNVDVFGTVNINR